MFQHNLLSGRVSAFRPFGISARVRSRARRTSVPSSPDVGSDATGARAPEGDAKPPESRENPFDEPPRASRSPPPLFLAAPATRVPSRRHERGEAILVTTRREVGATPRRQRPSVHAPWMTTTAKNQREVRDPSTDATRADSFFFFPFRLGEEMRTSLSPIDRR